MSYLLGFSSDETAKNITPQEFWVKGLGLPFSSNINSIKGNRRIRLLIPINNIFKTINEQREEAGEHWSLLMCDIQASNKGVKVKFGHFDSLDKRSSSNHQSSDVVARKIHKVSFYVFSCYDMY